METLRKNIIRNDDGTVVGCLPAIKEIPLLEQEYTTVHNIRLYVGGV